jgi:hypothetical protein
MIDNLAIMRMAPRIVCIWLALLIAVALSVGTVMALGFGGGGSASPSHLAGQTLYPPLVVLESSPAGSYYCLEYEYGLIWSSEVITLHPDGSSVFAYNPPYTRIVTGTWSYTAAKQEVAFTNFHWLTATYIVPNRLWASRYLTQAGFEIAVSCQRQ